MISLAGALAAGTLAWRAARRRGALVDEAISFMAREAVVLRVGDVRHTTLAWAFHSLRREFERGVSPARWAFLVGLPDAAAVPCRRGELDERCVALLQELAERGLIQRPPEDARRQDQWWLSRDGLAAVRRIGRHRSRYHAPAREPA